MQVTTYDGGQEIGKITKQWAGFVREYFTSADQFGVSCKRFCVSVRDRVQALADISRSALCCHSNETRASIANPPNNAQLKGTPTSENENKIVLAAKTILFHFRRGFMLK